MACFDKMGSDLALTVSCMNYLNWGTYIQVCGWLRVCSFQNEKLNFAFSEKIPLSKGPFAIFYWHCSVCVLLTQNLINK